MPSVDKFVQGAKTLKVKDLPTYASKFAGEHYNPAETKSRVMTWLHNYKKQHIDTGSVKPLFDLLGYGFALSYAISWPREHAHYVAEQEAKLKGAQH